eukprot:CAMPEP_0172477726 /NCGR_PEP_ID=MMETSP1066-20121228/1174_1 /TAXON_ID=671091 /ORGANISM="Coscinodiscus wailesii, Strain CCMP2513" /LENGTH=403 /DNA_ID=CAMNT_0013236571 /DNA_START=106 /DNA_END=1314 /DNA_ORIENTATION=-
MKLHTVTLILMLRTMPFMESNAFQVNPDPLSKQVIENVVKHKLDIQLPNPARKVPMINVIDDVTFPPDIEPKVESLIANLFKIQIRDSNDAKVATFTPRPLSASVKTKEDIPPSKRVRSRKIIGLDDDPTEYWFNNRIHTFGNVGLFGGLHAICAPLATFLIDTLAYDRLDVRTAISKRLREIVNRSDARVLDLCCGVGISTRALQSAFFDAEIIVGIDTSPQMIEMARFMNSHISQAVEFVNDVKRRIRGSDVLKEVKTLLQQIHFEIAGETAVALNELGKLKSKLGKNMNNVLYARGNAERTIFPDQSFDLVTIMYGFHEAPYLGRYLMLREARRVLQNGGTLALVDIVPEYMPSPSMLAGEPYVKEYQQNIHKQMKSIRGFKNLSFEAVIPGHVGVWLLT